MTTGRKTHVVPCRHCEKPFLKRTDGASYCSEPCRLEAQRIRVEKMRADKLHGRHYGENVNAPRPPRPCEHPPGSNPRIRALVDRFRSSVELFHPADVKMDDIDGETMARDYIKARGVHRPRHVDSLSAEQLAEMRRDLGDDFPPPEESDLEAAADRFSRMLGRIGGRHA